MTDLSLLRLAATTLLLGLLAASGCDGASDGGGTGDDSGDPTPIVGGDGSDTGSTGSDASSDDPADAGPTGDEDATSDGVPDGYVPGVNADTNVAPPDLDKDPQPLAGICTVDEDCLTGACNAGHPGGYCTVWCSGNSDCPDDGWCFKDTIGAGKKMCWKPCAVDADCRLDHFCTGGDFGVCTPKCTGSCPDPTYTCNLLTGICEAPGFDTCTPTTEVCDAQDNDCDNKIDEGCGPDIADSPTALVEDFGAVEVGGGGLSRQISFDVSTAAASYTILIIDADGSDEAMGVYQLTDPDGTVLMDPMDPWSSPIRALPEIGALAVQVPNTPSYTLKPGTHKFTVYRDGDAGFAWIYVIQSIREELSPSNIDINFWFVGTPGLSAATAPDSEKFEYLLNTFSATLANHSILLGSVKYFDVTGVDAQKYTYVDVTHQPYTVDEHAELLALSESLPASNRGVNIFLVQGFNGWGILGKAGGIPGPPLLHGTYHSGVVLSLVEYYELETPIGVPLTAEAMAHELGHQLGLFHTTEQTGDAFDPIGDTPQCPASKDTNNDGLVDPIECTGLGGDNLMFWSQSFATALSSGQKYVLHRNASMY